jgi:hypothetical protein
MTGIKSSLSFFFFFFPVRRRDEIRKEDGGPGEMQKNKIIRTLLSYKVFITCIRLLLLSIVRHVAHHH